MKKKVLRERRANKDKEVILNKLADEIVTEIVEEAKPKKRASKKKEA
jgi:hypothetical protein